MERNEEIWFSLSVSTLKMLHFAHGYHPDLLKQSRVITKSVKTSASLGTEKLPGKNSLSLKHP